MKNFFFSKMMFGSILAVVFSFLFVAPVSAALLCGPIVPPDCPAGSTFGLPAFIELALNILRFIWCIVGSLMLAMFVWGGFLWLTAGGEEGRVKSGWTTLTNAVIGLVIVLSSWVIINTIILSFTSPGQFQVAKLFGTTDWTDIVGGERCVSLAVQTKGYVPPVAPGTAPTVLAPLPPGGASPAGSPAGVGSPVLSPSGTYLSGPARITNPDLFAIEMEPITALAPYSGSVPIGVPAVGPMPTVLDDLVFAANLVTLPLGVGALLSSIGAKLVIKGAQTAGTQIILKNATMQVVRSTARQDLSVAAKGIKTIEVNARPISESVVRQITDGVNKASSANFRQQLEMVLQKDAKGVYQYVGERLR